MIVALPAEIVLSIAEACGSLRAVAFLCATCRHLCNILDPFLYQTDSQADSLETLRWAARAGQISTIIKWLRYRDAGGVQNDEEKALHTALHAAAASGQDCTATYLIDRGACIECYDYNHEPPLNQAVRFHHESTARILLQRGANPNHVDFTSETPLGVAAADACVDMVRLLLDHKANPLATNVNGQTPVAIAAYNGHTTVVQLLADYAYSAGCEGEADALEYALEHAVFQAVRGLSPATVGLLLRKGCFPPLDSSKGRALIMEACLVGSSDILQLLLDNGGDIEAKYEAGKTLLSVATSLDNVNMLQYLIQNGADVTAKDDDGQTVAMHLIQNQVVDKTTWDCVLDKSPDLNARDELGRTALFHATDLGAHATAEILLTAGCDAAISNWQGTTPLMQAAAKRHIRTVELCLDWHDANIDALDSLGQSALYLAVEKQHHDVVSVLVERGAGANQRTTTGRSLLSMASGMGNSGIARKLLIGGADINCRDSPNGRTPLMVAAAHKQLHMIKWLVSHGANVHLQDNTGCDAVVCAPAASRKSVEKAISTPRRERNARRE